MSIREEENEWENDPVWDLVDKTEAPEVSPLFVRNVMREVRLASETRLPWWKSLLSPRPVFAGSLAAVAATILILANLNPSTENARDVPGPTVIAEPQIPQLDALLDEEMLAQAAEDPSAFSDEALVALLSQ